MKLYVPGRGDQYAYPLLTPALTRPIRWERFISWAATELLPALRA